MRRPTSCLYAAVLAIVSSHAIGAVVTVTGASVAGHIDIDDGVYLDPGTDLSTSKTITSGSVVTSYTADPSRPSVSASVSTGYLPYFTYNIAGTSLDYYYVVSDATGVVPVDVVYDLKTSASAGGTSIAQVNVGQPISLLTLGFQDIIFQKSTDGLLDQSEKADTFVSQSDVGVTYVVSIGASATANSAYSTATAFADPHIFIDPTYLAAHPGATLSISAGVGNIGPSAVPEPAGWALMAAGLGLMAGRGRRRRTGA